MLGSRHWWLAHAVRITASDCSWGRLSLYRSNITGSKDETKYQRSKISHIVTFFKESVTDHVLTAAQHLDILYNNSWTLSNITIIVINQLHADCSLTNLLRIER